MNLVAGRFLQLISARNMMLTTDLLTGILFVGAYYLLQLGTHQIRWLAIIAVLNKTIGVFYKLSNKTILPTLFAANDLQRINGIQTQVRQLAIVSATMLVTLVLHWMTPANLILLMGLAFLLSALLDYQLQPNTRSQTNEPQLVTTSKLPIIPLLNAIGGCLIDAAVAVAIPWMVVTYLHHGWQLSWLLTAAALGIICAPLSLKWLPHYSLITLSGFASLCLLLMWPVFPMLLIAMFSLGTIRGQFNIRFFTELQTLPGNLNQLMMWTLTILDSATVTGNFLAPYVIHLVGHWILPSLGLGMCLLILFHFWYVQYQAKITKSTSHISANE